MTKNTDYFGGYVYEQDSLRFISHEEGRIRPIYKPGEPVQYAYDYFIKDHLGNIRTVLTDKSDNIDNTRTAKPVGYPAETDAGGIGISANIFSGGGLLSNTTLWNKQVPTAKRGFIDKAMNFFIPVEQALGEYVQKKMNE